MFAENVISGARATQLLAKARNAGVKIATRFLKKTSWWEEEEVVQECSS